MEAGDLDGKLHEAFVHWSPTDPKLMDGREFVKFCKDSKMLTKKVTTTDVDITFAKYKDKGGRKITFPQFKDCVMALAKKEGKSDADLCQMLASHQGPEFHGTKAQATKFHDDKSLYTGVYAHGGPDSKGGHITDLSQIADRSNADVRGTKK